MAQMGIQEQVLTDLRLDGEYVVEAQLHDAANFGVPQSRKRLLFLGIRRDLGLTPPVLDGNGATRLLQLDRRLDGDRPGYSLLARHDPDAVRLAAQLADPEDLALTTAAQAIGDLICLEPGRRSEVLSGGSIPAAASAYQRLMRLEPTQFLSNVSVPRIKVDTVRRLAEIPAGGNFRDLAEDLQARYLSGDRWGPDTGTGRLERTHYNAYRRLHPDIWAWTLNTKGDSAYHYGPARCLSVREFARLQSFPDRFIFMTDTRRGPLPGRVIGGAAHSRYRQAGNAVPPLLAAAVARAMQTTISAAGVSTSVRRSHSSARTYTLR
jgi:DNA (cytosine-5)-methyltransferase 1